MIIAHKSSYISSLSSAFLFGFSYFIYEMVWCSASRGKMMPLNILGSASKTFSIKKIVWWTSVPFCSSPSHLIKFCSNLSQFESFLFFTISLKPFINVFIKLGSNILILLPFYSNLYRLLFYICKFNVSFNIQSQVRSSSIETDLFSEHYWIFLSLVNFNICKQDLFFKHLSRDRKWVYLLLGCGNKAAYLTCMWAENQ